MCYIGLNKNRTNTKDVQMRIFRDKYIVNECICVFEWELVFEYDFLSSLWFEKKPLFFFDMARQSIKIRLRGANESPQISKEKTSMGVRLQHTHWKKPFLSSGWEFTNLLTQIRNIVCNFKVLIRSSYSIYS